MLSLYAKKVFHNLGYDVLVYDTPEMISPKAHYQWYSQEKPNYRNKYIMLNCYRWNLIWIK
jgi:hypothetical protein